jgi:hypothetical protein
VACQIDREGSALSSVTKYRPGTELRAHDEGRRLGLAQRIAERLPACGLTERSTERHRQARRHGGLSEAGAHELGRCGLGLLRGLLVQSVFKVGHLQRRVGSGNLSGVDLLGETHNYSLDQGTHRRMRVDAVARGVGAVCQRHVVADLRRDLRFALLLGGMIFPLPREATPGQRQNDSKD